MSFRAKTVMFAILNICMATAMSITADLMAGGLCARTLLMILLGFAVGMILGYLIPFDRISAATCRLFHCRQKSLAGNLLGNLIPSVINTVLIGAVMTAVNVLPKGVGFMGYLGAFGTVIRLLIPVAYAVACLANPLSVRAGLAVEKRIRTGNHEQGENA